MSKNIRTQMNKVVGKSLNAYYQRVKPTIDDIKFKEQYQGRIIDCMVGEVDDNYIETPETDAPIVKLEYSKEGLVKIPTIKGKTILVDADGNETDAPGEGCRLVSVGEDEDNKLIILSKNKNLIEYPYKDNTKTMSGVTITVNKDGSITLNGTSTSSGVLNFYLRGSNQWNLQKGTYSFSICSSNDSVYFVIGGSASDVVYTTGTRGTFVVNDSNIGNCGHCLIQIKPNATFNNVVIKPIIVSGNNIPTEYTPYNYHKTEILLNEPLYYGNYILDEKLIKKYRKVILDGGEKWENFNIHENTISVRCKVTNTDKLQKLKNARTDVKNNNLPYAYTQSDYEHYYMDSNFVIFLDKSKNIKSLEEFKKYLGNNNLEFIFELAEPIIEELPNSITLQGFDDTTMYIENSITPIVQYGYNALIPYKEELRTQKEEVETNTLDIEQNIIPYLMDMEFNLMLMEDE